MDINVKQLLLNTHTSKTFHLEEQGRDELLKDIDASFIEPVKVELTVENTGRVLAGEGKVHTVIRLHCSRCLEEILFSVNPLFYVTMIKSVYKDDFDGNDDFIIITENGDVDILPLVEEAIILNIPINSLCKDNCLGICPICGVDRNKVECKCQEQDIDPRWEKLKNLQ